MKVLAAFTLATKCRPYCLYIKIMSMTHIIRYFWAKICGHRRGHYYLGQVEIIYLLTILHGFSNKKKKNTFF